MGNDGTGPSFSRRALLRNGALAGAGAALAGTPLMERAAFAAAPAKPATAWPHLSAMAHDYVGKFRVANMIALMGRGDGPPALVGEGRDAIGGPRRSNADSLYRLYSMTKPITGMAAMILIDEGKLRLDQPLAEILAAFAEMQVQKKYDGSIGPENLEPAARPILIRHLLTHTAGLGYSTVQRGPIAEKMRDMGVVTGRVSRVPVPELDRGTPVNSLAQFADLLATFPLVYQPGTHWSYSTGLDLMGRVIEVVSGRSFDSFLQQRIFDPCGMTSTWFKVPESELGRLTMGYGVLNGEVVPIDPPQASVFALDPPFPMGGSGLVGSPRDYDRFLKMLAGYGKLDGKRVMSEAAVRLGTSDLLPSAEVTKGTSVAGYGYGAGGRIGWAGGKSAYGWAGAAGTVGFVDMASGMRGGLYTQFMPVSAYPLYDDFERAVEQDLALRKGKP